MVLKNVVFFRVDSKNMIVLICVTQCIKDQFHRGGLDTNCKSRQARHELNNQIKSKIVVIEVDSIRIVNRGKPVTN
jgi:hypothetical protein